MNTHYFFSALLLISAGAASADVLPAPIGTTAAAVSKAHVDFYRGGIGHTGVADEKLTAPLSVLWRHTTSYAKNNPASPVCASGIIYFASGGAVYALNAVDGTTKWRYPADGKTHVNFGGTPALSNGALYVADDSGQVYKLDAATGTETWTQKLEGAIRSAPVVSGGMVYFGSGNDHCYGLNADTGAVVWDEPTEGAITASPTVTGGLVVFTSTDNHVYSLNARTGKPAWSHTFDADPSIIPVVYAGSVVYVTAGDTIYRMDPSTGERRAPITLPTTVSGAPTVSGDSIYTITQNNTLYALSLSGSKRWQITLDGMNTAPPLLAGNLLIVATQSGVLSGYDSGSGKLTWRYVMQASATDSQPKYPSANVYAAPIVAGGTLFVVSDDGTLTAFRQDATDHVGPELSEMVPEAGATVRSEGNRGEGLTYGALVIDDGSGIDPASVSLSLDGEADTQAQYHAGQNAIYNTPVEPLKEGEHIITIKATDWRGNTTSQTWSFTVDDQSNGQGPGGAGATPFTPTFNPGLTPTTPNYPGNGGRNPNAPPPPPPIAPF